MSNKSSAGELEPTAGRVTAAFFDLDRTLMAGASAYHFGRAAYKVGMLTKRQILSDTYHQLKFRLKGATDDFAQSLCDRILESIKDHSVVEMGRLAPDVLAGILPRVYPQVLNEVRRHQDEGHRVYIATAAWQEITDLLAEVLQMDGGVATRAEIVDGYYTGRLAGPFTYGEGKAEAIRDLAAKLDIDLADSYAYSDSVSDLPMLKLVGNPVVVNPDAGLRAIAKEHGWAVMRFEKLGRRIAIGVTALLAAAVGGTGTIFARRRASVAGKGPKKIKQPQLQALPRAARKVARSRGK